MNIIAADDEQSQLNILTRSIHEAVPDATVHSFTRQSELLAELSQKGYIPDVAFLDIEMPGKTGLELAICLKKMCPNLNIVFVTGYSEYALDAIRMHSSGYILKPATCEKIRSELNNLRTPLTESVGKAIRVQCFGTFDVFVNGSPVHFSRSKSKEMLAYLVDRRGASCTSAEIAASMWDDGIYDRSRQKQYSNIRRVLLQDLQNAKAEQIIVKKNNVFAVDPTRFDCDYYRALDGDVSAINTFVGEYMSTYSWAEFTTATLNNKLLSDKTQNR